MKNIIVTDQLKEKVPGIKLQCIECNVNVQTDKSDLWKIIDEKLIELANKYKIEDISKIKAIQASRKSYKACGKDPARYRLSAEALLRRVIKGAGLYKVNNVVDQLNLVSVLSGYSIGGYDVDKINGDIYLGIGEKDEPYKGIGRGDLNIENLPVFRDETGAFGTPTSDSERTSVKNDTKRFLMIILCFGDNEGLTETKDIAVSLLKEFCAATDFEIKIKN